MTKRERYWWQLFFSDYPGSVVHEDHFAELMELVESGGYDDVDRMLIDLETMGGG